VSSFINLAVPTAAALAVLIAAPGWAQSLSLSDAWVRAMPPGKAMTAAYATIRNEGSAPVVVSGVSASRGEASLHETRNVDGRMSMRSIERLTVPAGGEVSLEPGGLHVMLMGLEQTPAVGDVLELCFHTAGEPVCTSATVSRRDPRA
jgi:copper(I)-binding protein